MAALFLFSGDITMNPLHAGLNSIAGVDSRRESGNVQHLTGSTEFSTAFNFARTKADLSQKSVSATNGTQPQPKTITLQSSLEQNAKIHNAAASLTGTEPSLHERALALRAYRTELLASNIANADTPNYKAVDIDINQALKNNTPLSQVPVQFSVASNAGVDGNSVDMDTERVKFAENSIMYEFAVDEVKGEYKSMMDLLKNLPY